MIVRFGREADDRVDLLVADDTLGEVAVPRVTVDEDDRLLEVGEAGAVAAAYVGRSCATTVVRPAVEPVADEVRADEAGGSGDEQAHARKTRRVRAFALLLVAVALTACGADPKEEARTLARAKGPPLYYLGDEFGELPLTSSLMASSSTASATARVRATRSTAKPQVQLQHHALAREHPAMFEATPTELPACASGTAGSRPVAAFATSGRVCAPGLA